VLLGADHAVQLLHELRHEILAEAADADVLASDIAAGELLAVLHQQAVLVLILVVGLLLAGAVGEHHRRLMALQNAVQQCLLQIHVGVHDEGVIVLGQEVLSEPRRGDAVGDVEEGVIEVADPLVVLQRLLNDLRPVAQHHGNVGDALLVEQLDGVLDQLLTADVHGTLGVAGQIPADAGASTRRKQQNFHVSSSL